MATASTKHTSKSPKYLNWYHWQVEKDSGFIPGLFKYLKNSNCIAILEVMLHKTLAVLLAGWLLLPAVAFASQGFYSNNNGTLRSGMLVSLTRNPGVVEPSTIALDTPPVGVVSDSTVDTLLEPGQISVETDGMANVLVSTSNGDIQVGDSIGLSSIVGFGAKSDSGWVVGTAQSSLTSSSEGAVNTKINTQDGGTRVVYTASIPVQVAVAYKGVPESASSEPKPIPDSLQDIADSIAGKQASTIAVILSFLLLATGFSIAALIIVTTIRSGILAISRQPLVRLPVTWRMTQSFGLALVIIVSANIGALILLRVL